MNIHIAKAGTEIEVPAWDALPEQSKTYLEDYAWKQVLNDAVASLAVIDSQICVNKVPLKDTSADQFGAIVMAKVQKKLDAIIDGSVRVAGVRVGDPIKADAIEIAIEMTVRGQFKKAGKPLDAKAMRQAAIELVARNPAYLHIAQKRADDLALEMELLNGEVGDEDLKGLEAK